MKIVRLTNVTSIAVVLRRTALRETGTRRTGKGHSPTGLIR